HTYSSATSTTDEQLNFNMSKVYFFSEDTDFRLKQKIAVRQWIKETARTEGFRTGELNVIFCSDTYLLALNKQYLSHDTFTDIVTFSNNNHAHTLSGDVFISIDRVRENAAKFGVDERDELHRVIIHGILHLCGYGDKGRGEKKRMTEKEDFYLSK